jgi:hypothetical protein
VNHFDALNFGDVWADVCQPYVMGFVCHYLMVVTPDGSCRYEAVTR